MLPGCFTLYYSPSIFFVVFRFEVDGEVKYLEKAKELVRPERNTLQVSYIDVEKHNSHLAVTITSEYYRY